MDEAKKQLADKLKTANNVLVTVSRNPSVDQLAACLGLTLLLNKQNKHTAAVFSGNVPSTIEFLQPEDTLEKNTDSLRDFIIALDKSKADKLRYKVEDNVVRIFITPYKTSISEADLDFSQGDFNVDVVVALGVAQQEDLDEAITEHGRILHDATVASINIGQNGGMGTIVWQDPQASSLSELVCELLQSMGENLLDEQIATALLTGIVSETERFSNDKTSSQTMSISAALMAAGANQQLVASKLEEGAQTTYYNAVNEGQSTDSLSGDIPEANDGTINIKHDQTVDLNDSTDASQDDKPADYDTEPTLSPGSRMITEAPTMGGVLTANSTQEALDPPNDPLGLPSEDPPALLERKADPISMSTQAPPMSTAPPAPPEISAPPEITPANEWVPPTPDQPLPDTPERTLSELEQQVKSSEDQPAVLDSPAVPALPAANVDTARDEISMALNNATLSSEVAPPPIDALNAQPLGVDLHPFDPNSPAAQDPTAQDSITPVDSELDPPPPVPPPIPFQFGNPAPPQ